MLFVCRLNIASCIWNFWKFLAVIVLIDCHILWVDAMLARASQDVVSSVAQYESTEDLLYVALGEIIHDDTTVRLINRHGVFAISLPTISGVQRGAPGATTAPGIQVGDPTREFWKKV